MVHHHHPVGGEVDVALDGLRPRLRRQDSGALRVLRRRLVEAPVGGDDRGAGEDPPPRREGLDGVHDPLPVPGDQAVGPGEDGGIGRLPAVGADPDGHPAGLDGLHRLRQGVRPVQHHRPGACPAGQSGCLGGVRKVHGGAVQDGPDPRPAGTGGLEDLELAGEDVHIHDAVGGDVPGEGGGGGQVLDAEPRQHPLVQPGQILLEGDAAPTVRHGEVGGHRLDQRGGASLPSRRVGGGEAVPLRRHRGGQDQPRFGLIDLGVVAVLGEGHLGGQFGQLIGDRQGEELRRHTVKGEGHPAVQGGAVGRLGAQRQHPVHVLADHAVPAEDGEGIDPPGLHGLPQGGGTLGAPHPAGQHPGALQAVGDGGVPAQTQLPEGIFGIGARPAGGPGAEGKAAPAALPHGVGDPDPGLDAVIPAVVPDGEDHRLIAVPRRPHGVEDAAGHIDVVGGGQADAAVVQQGGAVEGQVHPAVEEEGRGHLLALPPKGQVPAALLLAPPGGGRRLLVPRQGGGLGGDGLRRDLLRRVKGKVPGQHRPQLSLQRLLAGGVPAVEAHPGGQPHRLPLPGEGDGKALLGIPRDPDLAAGVGEAGGGEHALHLLRHRRPRRQGGGLPGHRHRQPVGRQLPGPGQGGHRLQVHRPGAALGLQGQGEASGLPGHHRQRRLPLLKFQGEPGLAVGLQGLSAHGESGDLPRLVQVAGHRHLQRPVQAAAAAVQRQHPLRPQGEPVRRLNVQPPGGLGPPGHQEQGQTGPAQYIRQCSDFRHGVPFRAHAFSASADFPVRMTRQK